MDPSVSKPLHHDSSSSTHPSEHPRFSTHFQTTYRPLPCFHPTRAYFQPHQPDQPQQPSHWSARDSRKNIYRPRTIHVAHQREPYAAGAAVPQTSEFMHIQQRLRHPKTHLKVGFVNDVSFWVAVTFVVGSCAWVVNGFLLFIPLVSESAPTHQDAAAWCAFAGGTLFVVGSYLMVVEALNTGHEQLFADALWGAVEGPQKAAEEDSSPLQEQGDCTEQNVARFRFIGAGSWRELGWLASFIQFCAASIFWVSTITGLPGVIPGFPLAPPTAITAVFFWTPQVLGGVGFIVSSVLLMLETQKRWWLPEVHSLGWHIAGWNLIGAAGFMLCGALGYGSLASTKVNFESVLATFWGSWAFLVGSVVQLFETLWREGSDTTT